MNIDGNSSHLLLQGLRTLETELHRDETRRNRKRMEALLHPDFVEFGPEYVNVNGWSLPRIALELAHLV
jgi:hypothetical protein